jgi:hypothetical protein
MNSNSIAFANFKHSLSSQDLQSKGNEMTITRVGSTAKYADGWSLAFGAGKKSSTKSAATATAKSTKKVAPKAAKAPAKKAAGKKAAGKKAPAKKKKG